MMEIAVLDSKRERPDEYDDLFVLLLDHASSGEAGYHAREIAAACLGENHLWQDMGLPDRQHLSDIFEKHFNGLYVRNSANMKWKKFLYKELCNRMEVHACRSPSCGICCDYANCFGPEVPGTRPM